ncbi:hypothetical protein HZB60_03005 [candidate division KSB1 bacterium]|nr:hypothetical protein [candidate division KSB1 bacterium]
MFGKIVRLNLLTGLLLLVAGGCTAPRDNPLDPRSDLFVPPVEEPTPPEFWYRVRTVHVSRNFPTTDVYYVQTELSVLGPDAADSVMVRYKQGAGTLLNEDEITGVWGGTFNPGYFGDQHLESTPGFPFVFTAYVRDKGAYSPPEASVVRVITETPVILSPAHGDTVGSMPELVWEAFNADFAYGFKVTVISHTAVDTAWTTPLFASALLSVTVPDSVALEPGEYNWTLAVIDSFENYSRSKEGEFVVAEAGQQ